MVLYVHPMHKFPGGAGGGEQLDALSPPLNPILMSYYCTIYSMVPYTKLLAPFYESWQKIEPGD